MLHVKGVDPGLPASVTFIRKTEDLRDTGRGHVKTEAETGGTLPQAQACPEALAKGRGRRDCRGPAVALPSP